MWRKDDRYEVCLHLPSLKVLNENVNLWSRLLFLDDFFLVSIENSRALKKAGSEIIFPGKAFNIVGKDWKNLEKRKDIWNICWKIAKAQQNSWKFYNFDPKIMFSNYGVQMSSCWYCEQHPLHGEQLQHEQSRSRQDPQDRFLS